MGGDGLRGSLHIWANGTYKQYKTIFYLFLMLTVVALSICIDYHCKNSTSDIWILDGFHVNQPFIGKKIARVAKYIFWNAKFGPKILYGISRIFICLEKNHLYDLFLSYSLLYKRMYSLLWSISK